MRFPLLFAVFSSVANKLLARRLLAWVLTNAGLLGSPHVDNTVLYSLIASLYLLYYHVIQSRNRLPASVLMSLSKKEEKCCIHWPKISQIWQVLPNLFLGTVSSLKIAYIVTRARMSAQPLQTFLLGNRDRIDHLCLYP